MYALLEVFIVKRRIIWILTGLMLSWLLSFSSIGLTDTDTWTKKADMPTPRTSLSTNVVNGRIYAIGGEIWVDKFSTVGTVEEYDTGFEVEVKGKLATTWGKIRAAH
jgi:hypothetical protein